MRINVSEFWFQLSPFSLHVMSIPVICFLTDRYGLKQGHSIPKNFIMLMTLLLVAFLQLAAIFGHNNVFLKFGFSP